MLQTSSSQADRERGRSFESLVNLFQKRVFENW